jgi:hypothetical protein
LEDIKKLREEYDQLAKEFQELKREKSVIEEQL